MSFGSPAVTEFEAVAFGGVLLVARIDEGAVSCLANVADVQSVNSAKVKPHFAVCWACMALLSFK
jgi:hypothetical protein